MLSNAYFLAKFRFDTAENEPAKNLQFFLTKFANFANFANAAYRAGRRAAEGTPAWSRPSEKTPSSGEAEEGVVPTLADLHPDLMPGRA